MSRTNKTKRAFDLFFSVSALLMLLPVFLTVSILLLLAQGRPIMFTQKRLGEGGKIFQLFKFRTMMVGSHLKRNGLQVSSNDPRVSRLGNILRSTSLDELPQLFNMIRGDLSLVGPRACLPEQLAYFSDKQCERFSVKPGLTGLATVKGRASIPWSRRLRWDQIYVKRQSFCLDMIIVLKTFSVVASRRNIYFDHEKYGPAFDLAAPDNLPQATRNGEPE